MRTDFKKKIDYVYEVSLLSSLKHLLSDAFILDEVSIQPMFLYVMHMWKISYDNMYMTGVLYNNF